MELEDKEGEERECQTKGRKSETAKETMTGREQTGREGRSNMIQTAKRR